MDWYYQQSDAVEKFWWGLRMQNKCCEYLNGEFLWWAVTPPSCKLKDCLSRPGLCLVCAWFTALGLSLILKFTTLGPDASAPAHPELTTRWWQHLIMASINQTHDQPPGPWHLTMVITGHQCYCCLRRVTLSVQSVSVLIPPINSVLHYN